MGLDTERKSVAYLFIPPTIDEGPMGGNWLFARYKRQQGITVYKIGNRYYEGRWLSQDDLEPASYVYTGGHEYYVSQEERDDLVAAGYTVYSV